MLSGRRAGPPTAVPQAGTPKLVPRRPPGYHPAIMAIRFSCASCKQPLEVDDAWGGQAVACPYCRHVVTAPSTSTWPTSEVPTASPVAPQAGVGYGPPPPPPGYASMGPAPQAWAAPRVTVVSLAGRAFTLALAGTVLAAAGYLVWFGSLTLALEKKIGPNSTPQQQQAALQELMASGQVQAPPRAAVAFFAVGLPLGIVGLVMAVRSLLRQEPRRGWAIAACILGACVTLCQVLAMLSALIIHLGARAG